MRRNTITQNDFWSRVQKTDNCWLWLGYPRTREGYGGYTVSGKTYLSHRFAYLITHGELPDELQVCHTCDNPRCVNPAHLFLGTTLDNMRDRDRKGRRNAVGTKNGAARLTEQSVRDLRRRVSSGESIPALAREFGVLRGAVWNAVTRRTWRHVE